MHNITSTSRVSYIPLLIGIAWCTLTCLMVFSPQGVFAGGGLVEPCALERPGEPGAAYCNDVNYLVLQLIRIAEFLLGIAGSIALVMFVYGGFVYLTAFGKSEQAKKGQQVLIAAVIGLVIVFSAFLIVDFVVKGLGVSSYFTG